MNEKNTNPNAEERDRRFKHSGNVCMGIILACFAAMLIVGRQCQGSNWLGIFFLAMGLVIAGAFVYSIVSVSRRLKEDSRGREDDR